MIEFRPFRNSDPPLIAELWRSQPSQRGLTQPMSSALFEQLVLSRPIFDRDGLILGVEDGHALGFVHAGFGPNASLSGPATELGFASMLMVHSGEQQSTIAAELLDRAETYLRSHGAKQIYAGGIDLLAPFYTGLYGGSQLSGILQSDHVRLDYFRAQGYSEVGRSIVMDRELGTFRPVVDRRQLQLRRRAMLHVEADPPARTWWQACLLGQFTRIRYELQTDEVPVAAWATFWDMEPLSHTWGVHAAGLVELEVEPQLRRQGFATYLLGEALRQLHSEGISLVEAQCDLRNSAAGALLERLGFTEVDQSIAYCKE